MHLMLLKLNLNPTLNKPKRRVVHRQKDPTQDVKSRCAHRIRSIITPEFELRIG
jgi:hypothetical protein